jgi:AraC family transcriptional regulator
MKNSPVQTAIFDSPALRIGLFRCRPMYPNFANTGPASGYLIVFPRTSVNIIHAGCRPIVADPNVVMFYNQHQQYTRDKLSDRGDLCEWFVFDRRLVIEAIQPFDSHVVDREDRLFTLSHGPSDPGCHLRQRMIVDHILGASQLDRLYVEETMLSVLGQVVADAYRAQWCVLARPAADISRAGAELTDAIKRLLAAAFREPLSLEQIARKVHTSPYHLCRVFRRQTGGTIHSYLNQLRLRTALKYIAQGDNDLATLGVEMGYSSHSHFTQAFKRAFGAAPSDVRRMLSPRQARELSKIMIA